MTRCARDAADDSSAAMWSAKARAELEEADRALRGVDVVAWRGALLAESVVVKGEPGPAEDAGGAAVSGLDGDAAHKALAALGFDPDRVFYTLSRPAFDIPAEARADRLRMQIEAVDPDVALALDAQAAEDLAGAFGLSGLAAGVPTRVQGRTLLAVDGLESSLGDPALKREVWTQMKELCPRGQVF